eukprot:334045-Pyramimonas_sp.AAC.1
MRRMKDKRAPPQHGDEGEVATGKKPMKRKKEISAEEKEEKEAEAKEKKELAKRIQKAKTAAQPTIKLYKDATSTADSMMTSMDTDAEWAWLKEHTRHKTDLQTVFDAVKSSQTMFFKKLQSEGEKE